MSGAALRWRDPTPAALLDSWERAAHQPAGRRAAGLLETAFDSGCHEGFGTVSVGVRDAALLTLRERLFGPAVCAVVACPACGERQELAFDIRDVRVPHPDGLPDLRVYVDGHSVEFRLPTGTDLDEAAAEGDVERAARRLLDACLIRVSGRRGPLPDSVVAAVAERMALADPQADVSLALRCDACDAAWTAPFDIAAFLWAEVDAWAWRLLTEVHRLASVYGWSERDVLALGPRRRQIYLELAGR